MSYWSDQQLARATTPQATDVHGRAIIGVADRYFAANPLAAFYVRSAYTCPSAALPALIVEMSLQEFIAPGLPEDVVRDIIANGWRLQEAKGCDEGVRLGLSLLGMVGEIEHWWQVEPRRTPNTRRITFYLGRQLFPGSGFGEREFSAAQRMVNATKRWSQDTDFSIGIRRTAAIYHGAFVRCSVAAVATPLPSPAPVMTAPATVGVALIPHIHATARPQ